MLFGRKQRYLSAQNRRRQFTGKSWKMVEGRIQLTVVKKESKKSLVAKARRSRRTLRLTVANGSQLANDK